MSDEVEDMWYPQASKEQLEILQAEEQKITSSVPVLQDVIDWYDARITEYSDPKTILGVNPSSDAGQVKWAVLFAQTLVADYKLQRDEFATKFAQYLQESDE